MSVGPTLKTLVTARLTAAAEEIFALFERTIAEYEEELRLCKEKQRRQEQLETLRPTVLLPRAASTSSSDSGSVTLTHKRVKKRKKEADAQIPPQTPGSGLNKKIPETPQVKEEQSIKREEQLPEPVPECSAVFMKTESSMLQKTELRAETQDDDIIDFCAETVRDFYYADNDVDYSSAQMQTDEDHYLKVLTTAKNTTSQNNAENLDNGRETSTSVNTRHRTAQGKTYQCPYCGKVATGAYRLKRHLIVHTGERPFSCSTCGKTFARKYSRDEHATIHTGVKPYTCTICNRSFRQARNRNYHKLKHSLNKKFTSAFC